MEDLSAVPQEKIVDYLLKRLEHGQIYTWVGTLLLAINPNSEIITRDIYDLSKDSRAHEYDNICDGTHKEVPPHIFAVAARAHYRIVQNLGKPSQVIVLNGKTGTGKTFNAWKALEFLTRSTSLYARERRDAVCGIVRRISDACRLISAFTTAPTERNNVSSRHVQLVWLEYKMGGICGATISSYLLERDRVTKGRCNFQIFAQMMTAVANIEFADTALSRDTRYIMLSDLDFGRAQELRAYNDFRETLWAMDMLGFTENQKKDIFLVLALLIHMGDIQFVQEDDYCRIDTASRQSREALKNTCRLAHIEEKDITELLTSTLINPQSTYRHRHTTCRRNLNTSDACRYRLHSIIRHLYDLLFRWLINSVNEILSARLYSERLGILDIFGFECFKSNGIEQLCVNYVNERLQQYFVENLVSCRNDLQNEGLIDDEEPSEIARLYEDRINTIEKYLFATLNDMCLSTVSSDSSALIRQMYAKSSATRRFFNIRNENFVMRHYSNAVEYSIDDLLSKNTDKIPDEIVKTFSVSENEFLYSLINKSKSYNDGKAKKPTMLSKLRWNVDLLIQELNKCDKHYVRCIKLQRLNSHEWNRDELREQLANTSILDVLPVARCKHSIRFTYKDFYKRYNRKSSVTYDYRVACKNILDLFRLTMNDDNSSVHYGKRLIFLKESIFLQLESARRQYQTECVWKIESFWIKHKRCKQQNTKENIIDDASAIASVQDKSTEELAHIAVSEVNFSAELHQPQNIKDSNNSKTNNTKAVVADIQREQSQFEKSLLEYERILPIEDVPRFVTTGNYIELLTKLVKKTAYILHWLDNVNNATDAKNIKRSILEQLRGDRLDRLRNESIDYTDCSKEIQIQDALSKPLKNNKFRTRHKCEKNFGCYNEKEDMYVIEHGTFMLFYKNGILSRRRPIMQPVRIHTRSKCLTNSQYLTHTDLSQGLQDCL